MIALIALAAALPTVFGIPLGDVVALPECAHARISADRLSSDLYDPSQTTLCQQIPGVEHSPIPNEGGIVFPLAEMPIILSFPKMTTIVIDKKIEAIRADTLSFNSSPAIIDQLTEKFGPPSEKRPETIRVGLAAYPSVRVLWIRDGYRVEYSAIGGSLNYGWVRVETDKARAIREAEERAVEAKRTPL